MHSISRLYHYDRHLYSIVDNLVCTILKSTVFPAYYTANFKHKNLAVSVLEILEMGKLF